MISIDCAKPGVYSQAIAFARSTDGGRTFAPAFAVPGSFSSNPNAYAWDPAIAVAPSGVVYASFMVFDADTGTISPVVAASFDYGQTFPQVSALPVPPSTDPAGNWGDRDFIAVSRNGTVYVTWDYGPSFSQVQFNCPPTGSCAFGSGDFNAVIQKSTDGGKTWTALTPVSPGFPTGGAVNARVLVQPDGTVDVLYRAYPTDPNTLALSPASEYFTQSRDGGQTWTAPVRIGPGAGTVSTATWWIDGYISTDQAGNLYAAWDTQTASTDVGWLAYSTDGGSTWSSPIRVTPDAGNNEELTEVVGARPRTAYLAWQTPAAPEGYATFIRPYSITHGWLAPTTQVSTAYGDSSVWPGDTFGIATAPGDGSGPIGPAAVVSWGSAINGSPDMQIFSSIVRFAPHPDAPVTNTRRDPVWARSVDPRSIPVRTWCDNTRATPSTNQPLASRGRLTCLITTPVRN